MRGPSPRAARFERAREFARLAGALGAAWVLAGCATPVIGPIDETWFACTRDRQCTIAEDPTCTLVPINRRYAEPFAQRVRLNRPLEIARGPCSKPLVRYAAVCEIGRCASDARGLVRRRAPRERP